MDRFVHIVFRKRRLAAQWGRCARNAGVDGAPSIKK